jgi:hypothetical protein
MFQVIALHEYPAAALAKRELRAFGRGLAVAMSLMLFAPAQAAPMQPEECDRAKTEQAALVAAGTGEDLARGPDWARRNLAPDRLDRVKRWIELEEQILFRCPRPKPPPAPAGAAASPAAGQPKKNLPLPVKKPKVNDAYRSPAPFSGLETQHATPGQ